MKPIIFCDFDGTITEKDNIIALMREFAPPEWNSIKDAVLARKISIREGVGRMFSLIPSSRKNELIHFISKQAVIRDGFADFVSFARRNDIPLYIVSGGIDFFVEPILQKFGPFSGVYCNGSDFSGETIKILWPHACDQECSNDCGCCKPSIMRKLSDNESFNIVIGDSVTDLEAAKQADLVLARDYLKEKCIQDKMTFKDFETFYDCIEALETMLGVKL